VTDESNVAFVMKEQRNGRDRGAEERETAVMGTHRTRHWLG
jgi:hypothetical protein